MTYVELVVLGRWTARAEDTSRGPFDADHDRRVCVVGELGAFEML